MAQLNKKAKFSCKKNRTKIWLKNYKFVKI